MLKLTVTIITYNEARNIERCLRSVLRVADEIVVVDSFSTDNTVSLCEGFGARVVQQAFKGYGLQKRAAIELAMFDHILALDADEELSEELIESIIAVKKDWQTAYYTFNRLNFYCGKAIKHGGWYPDRQIRLFDRRLTNWNLRNVHETVEAVTDVRPIHLSGNLNHYTCQTVEEHQKKELKYAEVNAEMLIKQGRQVSRITPYIKGGFRFFKSYVLQLGFLDGYYGWVIACTVARSSFFKYNWARKALRQINL